MNTIDAARLEVREAASKGYDAYMAAKAKLAALEADLPSKVRFVHVGGDTYNNRQALKRLGLKWDAASKTWAGEIDPADLPRGCKVVPATTTLGEHAPCRRCGTYCQGDCMAH